jgi:hypothetical protein
MRAPAHLPATASRRLLRAVLRRAMRDVSGPLGTGSTACTPLEREHARAWFQDDSVRPMSFRWLCLALDLEPEGIMRRLMNER